MEMAGSARPIGCFCGFTGMVRKSLGILRRGDRRLSVKQMQEGEEWLVYWLSHAAISASHDEWPRSRGWRRVIRQIWGGERAPRRRWGNR
jgi:hypothetical protein